MVADFLSRVPKIDDTLTFDDQFPDEHLFSIALKTPWYANVVNYLAVGKLPRHLTSRERKLIVSAAQDSLGLEDTYSIQGLICTYTDA